MNKCENDCSRCEGVNNCEEEERRIVNSYLEKQKEEDLMIKNLKGEY